MGLFDSTDENSQAYLDAALQNYQNIGVPTEEEQNITNLPQETVQGQITPQTIQPINQASSAYNNISLDPATRQAQMNALAGYSSIANAGGLDANARLGIQQAINAANTQSQGAQGAIMNTAQAQGQGGGDFALTQRALAAQGASNNAANSGMQAAAEAEANRENALGQMGSLGGNINASDYNQAAQKAQAQNAINASNQNVQNAAATQNVANNMSGQNTNLANAQNVNNANTGANQNLAYYRASLPQQQFNNEMSKASGTSGIATTQANSANEAAKNSANSQGQLMGGMAQMGAMAMMAAKGGAISGRCYANGGAPHDHAVCLIAGGALTARNKKEQANVPGDSKKNDKIPAYMSEDELVIPRSVPKTGEAMEKFARSAPVNGDPKKRIDMVEFTKSYKKKGNK